MLLKLKDLMRRRGRRGCGHDGYTRDAPVHKLQNDVRLPVDVIFGVTDDDLVANRPCGVVKTAQQVRVEDAVHVGRDQREKARLLPSAQTSQRIIVNERALTSDPNDQALLLQQRHGLADCASGYVHGFGDHPLRGHCVAGFQPSRLQLFDEMVFEPLVFRSAVLRLVKPEVQELGIYRGNIPGCGSLTNSGPQVRL